MPKNWLQGFDPEYFRLIREIGEETAARNIPAYLVGGVVRDLVLKRGNLDIDIVLEGDAAQFAEGFAKKNKADFVVHAQFATATIFLPGGPRLDLATARKERYCKSGALPIVEAGSIRDDLFRRDFTINAMAFNINPKTFGERVDFYNGWQDLKGRLVRVLHEKSFIDDPTRILRAIRFEQRFNFFMEKKTLNLLKSALRKKIFNAVKPERYFQEFRKFFKEPNPWKCLRRLHQLGGLGFLGKGFLYTPSMEKLLKAAQKESDRWQMQAEFKNCDFLMIYFMILFNKTSMRQLAKILNRFNFRKEERKNLLGVKEILKSGRVLGKKDLRPSQVYEILKPYHRAAILFLKIKSENRIAARRIDRFLKKDARMVLNINGHDLRQLGFQSGEEMGNILHKLRCEKIDGRLHSRQEELKRAAQLLNR